MQGLAGDLRASGRRAGIRTPKSQGLARPFSPPGLHFLVRAIFEKLNFNDSSQPCTYSPCQNESTTNPSVPCTAHPAAGVWCVTSGPSKSSSHFSDCHFVAHPRLLQGLVTMSGDLFGHHSWGWGYYCHPVGRSCEISCSAQDSFLLKNFLVPNVSRAEFEKFWFTSWIFNHFLTLLFPQEVFLDILPLVPAPSIHQIF